jgi:hypothetical protein
MLKCFVEIWIKEEWGKSGDLTGFVGAHFPALSTTGSVPPAWSCLLVLLQPSPVACGYSLGFFGQVLADVVLAMRICVMEVFSNAGKQHEIFSSCIASHPTEYISTVDTNLVYDRMK